ncbi:MAG: hypothetical protein LBI27_01765, partial [Clostridiales bacterium]|nr:hypothetical protein [Clostridiales bacterium]
MYKKKFFILIILAVIFSACGNEREMPTELGIPITEIAVPEETYEPEIILPEETPEPEEIPESVELRNTVMFESGIMGIKLSVVRPAGWELRALTTAGVSMHIMYSTQTTESDFSFAISQETTHPSDFRPPYEYADWRDRWQQPEMPSDVFVTEHGITIVEYSLTAQHLWNEDLYKTALFIFREDGRDYREIPGTQIFYLAAFDVREENFELFYDEARAVLNSLQFHDGAEVAFEPSAQADAIGITARNFPRIDGSTSVVALMREMIWAMYDAPEQWQISVPYYASRTVPSYELLINNYVDLILVPEPSEHVLLLAENAGVELEFIPIAVEA